MELIAWLSHKFIMHGFLWSLHKDHHKKSEYGFFEKNDYFFLIFAMPGIAGLFLGMKNDFNYLFWIGLGISLYGLCYFIVHDIYIHRRFIVFKNSNNSYFTAIRKAHKLHHKNQNKENGEYFGMLWVPYKYYRKYKS